MRRHPRFRATCLVVCLLHLGSIIAPALAGPEGGAVAAGAAGIQQGPGVTTVTQYTDRAIVNWQSFSSAAGESIKFVQPSTQSAMLNRVTDGTPSRLNGALEANGNVFLLNPNGVVFGRTSRVDVGGLVASTLSMSDSDFMRGHHALKQDPGRPLAAVVNNGTIRTRAGGAVALVAPVVDNQGTIEAPQGRVALAAGTEAVVNLEGAGLINVAVSNGAPRDVTVPGDGVSATLKSAVNSSGIVEAGSVTVGADGTVVLGRAEGLAVNGGTISVAGATGKAAGSVTIDSTQASVVAGKSVIDASGAGERSRGGDVRVLSAGNTLVAATARIAARGGLSGDGGFVEVSGAKSVQMSATPDTSAARGRGGELLIDPVNLTITEGPGDLDGGADLDGVIAAGEAGSTLSVGSIQNALGMNALVRIQAQSALTFQNTTGLVLPASSSLMFEVLNGSISTTSGFSIVAAAGGSGKSVTFKAGGAGGVDLFTSVSTQITLDLADHALVVNAGDAVDLGTITTSTGSLDIDAGRGVRFSGVVFSDDGAVDVLAGKAGLALSDIVIAAADATDMAGITTGGEVTLDNRSALSGSILDDNGRANAAVKATSVAVYARDTVNDLTATQNGFDVQTSRLAGSAGGLFEAFNQDFRGVVPEVDVALGSITGSIVSVVGTGDIVVLAGATVRSTAGNVRLVTTGNGRAILAGSSDGPAAVDVGTGSATFQTDRGVMALSGSSSRFPLIAGSITIETDDGLVVPDEVRLQVLSGDTTINLPAELAVEVVGARDVTLGTAEISGSSDATVSIAAGRDLLGPADTLAVVAGNLTLAAGRNILPVPDTGFELLLVDSSTLSIVANGAGARVRVGDSGGMTLESVTATGAGADVFVSNPDLSGDIEPLAAFVPDGTLTIEATFSGILGDSDPGSVLRARTLILRGDTIGALDPVDVAGGVVAQPQADGDVNLRSPGFRALDLSAINGSLNIELTGGTLVLGGGSGGGIVPSSVSTIAAVNGVKIVATGSSAIVDDNPGIDLFGPGLTILGPVTVGTAIDPIDIAFAEITKLGLTGTSGYLLATGGIDVVDASTTGQVLSIATASGSLNVEAASSGGTLQLSAFASQLVSTGFFDITAPQVELFAQFGIFGDDGTPFTVDAGTLSASSPFSSVVIAEANNVTLGTVTGASVELDAQGNVAIGGVVTATNAVAITAGALFSANGTAPDIIAPTIEVAGVNGVGSLAAPLDVVTPDLALAGSSAGSVYIAGSGPMAIDTVAAAVDANVRTATGSLSLEGTVIAGGTARLEASTGSILDAHTGGADVDAGAVVLVANGGVVGTLADPLELMVDGGVGVTARQFGAGGVSVALAGSLDRTRVLAFDRLPGLVVVNGLVTSPATAVSPLSAARIDPALAIAAFGQAGINAVTALQTQDKALARSTFYTTVRTAP